MKGGTRSYEMAKRMVEAGHEVHMITSRRDLESDNGKWVNEDIEGINVHWLAVPYHNSMSYKDRISAFFKFAFKAGKKAKQIGGDIIFATSTPLTIAIPAIRAKKALNVPMVFEVRDLWPELPIAIGALRSPITKYLAKKLEKYAYRNSDHIVALSPGMAEGVAKAGYPLEKISEIPNSCDLVFFDTPNSAGENFRNNRAWLGNRPLVLYTGTLGHLNGVTWLADLAAEVHELDPDIRFLVLGEGVTETRIIRRAKELGVYEKNFFMEPRVPKKEVPAALNAATVCTSLFIPLKEMEANSANKFFDSLAARRPIAINYGGWQKSLIEENNVGVALEQSNLQGSAKKLVELVRDKSQLDVMGENARRLGEQHFSRDILASKLIETLNSVVVSDKK